VAELQAAEDQDSLKTLRQCESIAWVDPEVPLRGATPLPHH